MQYLASDSSTVRITGVDLLESIGHKYKHLRQFSMDTLCAYLRS